MVVGGPRRASVVRLGRGLAAVALSCLFVVQLLPTVQLAKAEHIPCSTDPRPGCTWEPCNPPEVGFYHPGCIGGSCPPGTSGIPPSCTLDGCPSGTVGTPPACESPFCPPGSTGTFPDCTVPCPQGTSGASPFCIPDGACPPPASGTLPDCSFACPPPTTGTPPDCQAFSCKPGQADLLGQCIPCPGGFGEVPSCDFGPCQAYPLACAPDQCPPGTEGSPVECNPPPCDPGEAGTPPACTSAPCPPPAPGLLPELWPCPMPTPPCSDVTSTRFCPNWTNATYRPEPPGARGDEQGSDFNGNDPAIGEDPLGDRDYQKGFAGPSVKQACLCGGDKSQPSTVNTNNGEFVARQTVLKIPAPRGFDFSFDIVYRNQSPYAGREMQQASAGDLLGLRWDFTYGRHLRPLTNGDVERYGGDGRMDLYVQNGTSWDTPAGFYNRLDAVGGGWTVTGPSGTVEAYDATGKLQSITDRNGNAMTFTYATVAGRPLLQKITDVLGRDITVAHEGAGRITALNDFLGRSVQFRYDGTGALVNFTTVGRTSPKASFTYENGDQLATVGDGLNNTYIRNVYGGNRVVRQEWGLGQWRYLYDQTLNHTLTAQTRLAGNVTSVTDPNGNTVLYVYHPGVVQPAGKIQLMDRGINPNDPAFFTTYYQYNRNLETVLISQTAGEYNPDENQTRAMRTYFTSYQFDDHAPDVRSRGNLLEKMGGGRWMRYAYEPAYNQVRNQTQALGQVTWYDYDLDEATMGDLNGDGVTTATKGNRVRVRHPVVNPSVVDPNEYYSANVPNSAFSASFIDQAAVETYTYNAFGQMLTHKDAEGAVEKWAYNTAGPAKDYPASTTRDFGSGTDPDTGRPYANAVTTYAFNANGNLDAITGPNGETTALGSQPDCTISSVSLPGLPPINIQRDAQGQVTQTDRSRGTTTVRDTYLHDLLGRRTQAVRTEVGGAAPPKTTNVGYDLAGNRILVQSAEAAAGAQPDNIETFVFDERHLVYSKTRGGATAQFRAQSIHPGLSLGASTSTGATQYSTYDPRGKLVNQTDEHGATTQYRYHHDGYLVRKVDALGTVFETYHDLNQNPVAEIVFEPHALNPGELSAADAWHPSPGFHSGKLLLHSCIGPCLDGDWFPVPGYNLTADGRVACIATNGPSGAPMLCPVRLGVQRFDQRNRLYQTDRLLFDPVTRELLANPGALTPGDHWVSSLTELDRQGRTARTVDDNGHASTMLQDGLGRLIRRTDPLGNQVATTYDAGGNPVGQVEQETDGATTVSYTTTRTYDSANRLLQEVLPGGFTTQQQFDGAGQMERKRVGTDPWTNYTYDDAGRQVGALLSGTAYDFQREPAPASPVTYVDIETLTSYDRNGRALQRTDGLGQSTSYTYDEFDHLLTEMRADGAVTSYRHRPTGELLSKTDPNGNTVVRTYDALSRLVRVGVAGVGGSTVEYQYDSLGRMTRSHNTMAGPPAYSHATVRSYDSLGRVLQETQDTFTQTYRYDGVGNQMLHVYPDGRAIHRTYDALNRVTAVQESNGTVIAQYTYFGPSRVATKTFGNGLQQTDTYDASRRLQERITRQGATTRLQFQTAYDLGNQPTSDTFWPDATSTTGYSLDAANRLHTADGPRPFNGTYDEANNLQREFPAGAPGGIVMVEHVFNAANQLVRDEHYNETLALLQAEEYQYDRNGNLVQAGDCTFAWDVFGRLVSAQCDDRVVGYQYDAQDRRVAKFVAVGTQGTATTYVLDGMNEVEERDGAGALRRQFVFGPGVDEVLSMDSFGPATFSTVTSTTPVQPAPVPPTDTWCWQPVPTAPLPQAYPCLNEIVPCLTPVPATCEAENTVTPPSAGNTTNSVTTMSQERTGRRFFHADRLGSIRAVSDASGKLVEGYRYDAYGLPMVVLPGSNGLIDFGGDDVVVTSGASAQDNPFLYTGRRWDPETGLYYYRTRYYEPEMKRFISPDTVGIWADGLNLGNGYAYVGNRPEQYADPSGESGTSVAPPGLKKFLNAVEDIREGIVGLATGEFHRRCEAAKARLARGLDVMKQKVKEAEDWGFKEMFPNRNHAEAFKQRVRSIENARREVERECGSPDYDESAVAAAIAAGLFAASRYQVAAAYSLMAGAMGGLPQDNGIYCKCVVI